jgi:sulfotransferase family protein
MTLPTFFIVGAPKTGTTSLHYYLDQHPQIHMSSVKEPHFFIDPDNIPAYVTHRVTKLDDYEKLFDSMADARGEASPSYAEYPRHKGAPERIRSIVPDAKFIYVVRDPIDRTISHYMHHVAVDGERRSLCDALGDLSDPESPYICPSLYASQIDRYLKYFPPERILVIDQVDLLENRIETLRDVFTFLSVDATFSSPRFDEKLGQSLERRVYPQGYMRFIKRATTSSLRRLPRGMRRYLRRSVEKALWPPLETPDLDDRLRCRLEERYAEEVARLRLMTGKSFASWSI